MKISSGVAVAFIFLTILLVITGGVWLYQALVPSGSTASEDSGGGIFSSLFPFGSGGGTGDGGTGGAFGDELTGGPAPALRKVSAEQVAGMHFATGIQGTPSLRYTERNTGHWYETPVDSLTVVRLTNTTIPAVHDTVPVNASSSIMRFLADNESIENFMGTYSGTTTDRELEGLFLKRYARVAVGAGGTVLGVLETPAGSTIETVAPDGDAPKVLATSPLSSWIPLAGGNKFFVASAPSGGVRGSVYDISNGRFERVVGDISGLQALPNTAGTRLLISAGNVNAAQLFSYDMSTKTLTTLPLGTLVGKCAWVPSSDTTVLCAVPQSFPQALYPDDWLLGRAHTADSLWFIDTATGATTAAMELTEQAGEPIDASQVAVSDDGRFAAFINKNDQLLWLATLQGR